MCVRRGNAAYILGADTRTACGSFVYILRECVCKKEVRGVHSRSRYTHRLWKFRVHPEEVCVLEGGTRRTFSEQIHAPLVEVSCTP